VSFWASETRDLGAHLAPPLEKSNLVLKAEKSLFYSASFSFCASWRTFYLEACCFCDSLMRLTSSLFFSSSFALDNEVTFSLTGRGIPSTTLPLWYTVYESISYPFSNCQARQSSVSSSCSVNSTIFFSFRRNSRSSSRPKPKSRDAELVTITR